MKETSKMIRDQPLTPLDTAKFWVEYVIRYKGAPQLKSVAPTLSTIVYYNIDAYAILLAVVLLILTVPILVIRKLVRFVLGGNKSSKGGSQKNKVKKN